MIASLDRVVMLAMRIVFPWISLAAGAVAWANCFAPEPRLVLPWVALVPLIYVLDGRSVRRRGTAAHGLFHGMLHWAIAVSWILPTVSTFGGLPWAVGALALLGVAWLQGIWQCVFALCSRRILRHSTWGAMVGVAAAWVIFDWLRGHVPGVGFPWNQAGYAWIAMPGALVATAWLGTYGLSFLLIFANAGLALGLRRRQAAPAVVGVLLPLLILGLAGRFSRADPDQVVRFPASAQRGTPTSTPGLSLASASEPQPAEVVIIQPGSPLLDENDHHSLAYARLLDLSQKACGRPLPPGYGRLLVWPESAAYPHAWETSNTLRGQVLALAEQGCAVLLNTPLAAVGAAGIENTAILVAEDGTVARYAKQRLVPFGEYVPLGELLPFVGTLARIHEPFQPGRQAGVVPWGNRRLGLSICFEVTYPELSTTEARAGVQWLLTITNDAWYGPTAAPQQHFLAARFRAAENRLPLLRAALTGVSGVVDAHGQVVDRMEVGEVGTLVARLGAGTSLGPSGVSPYARAPWLPLLVSLVLLLAFGIIPPRDGVPVGPANGADSSEEMH